MGFAHEEEMERQGKYIFGFGKVGEKGQIVIPKKARDIFNIRPGDSLLIVGDMEHGLAIMPADKLHEFADVLLSGGKEDAKK